MYTPTKKLLAGLTAGFVLTLGGGAVLDQWKSQNSKAEEINRFFGENAATVIFDIRHTIVLSENTLKEINAAVAELVAANKKDITHIQRNGITYRFLDAPSGEPFGYYDPTHSSCRKNPLQAQKGGRDLILSHMKSCGAKSKLVPIS